MSSDVHTPSSLDVDGGQAQAVREIERLTRNAETARPEIPGAVDELLPDHVLARISRPGDTLQVRDLERYQDRPVRARGSAEVHDAESFVALVRRWGTEGTTLWATQPTTGAAAPSITAVLNDHDPVDLKHTAPDATPEFHTHTPTIIGGGWGDHRVTLVTRPDVDWRAWALRDAGHPDPTVADRAWMDQVKLAEFLHDQLPNIVDPNPGELLDAVTTFEAKQNVTFNSAVRLEDGAVQMQWVENTDRGTAGTTQVPSKLTVRIRPFYGAPAVDLDVWIRYRIAKGTIRFGLFRHRPDIAEDGAWQRWCTEVSVGLPGLPLVQGVPAGPVQAAQVATS